MIDQVTLPRPEQVDPERLTVLLVQAGWRLVGSCTGVYNRFAPPDLHDESGLHGALMVPLDRSAPEFAQMMSAAMREVSGDTTADRWSRLIAPRIVSEAADQFEFRRETAVRSGLIPWRQGEELVRAARLTLSAGAKSHVQKMRRYGNKLGQFSSRFLDSVLMGQTALGSYVVTAYAPTNVPIPVFVSSVTAALDVAESGIATGRDVTRSVAMALEATVEALEHYRQTSSMAAFDAGTERGVSFDLSMALREFADGSDGGDITIAWDEAADLREPAPMSCFPFAASDRPALERAAAYLASTGDKASRETIMGTVHLLTKKEPGAPGVFGLASISGSARRVRVRLRDELEYHRAVRAHDEDLVLAVDGRLERDGNLHWLVDAEIVSVLSSVDELKSRLTQLPLDEDTF